MPKGEDKIEEVNVLSQTLKRIMKEPMKASLSRLAFTDIAEAIVEQNPEMDVTEAVALSVAAKAFNGDVGAMTFLRDTVGEKPKDKQEVDNKITVDFSMTLVGNGTLEELSDNNPIEATLEEKETDEAQGGEDDSEGN